jgi:hypothetical protein
VRQQNQVLGLDIGSRLGGSRSDMKNDPALPPGALRQPEGSRRPLGVRYRSCGYLSKIPHIMQLIRSGECFVPAKVHLGVLFIFLF